MSKMSELVQRPATHTFTSRCDGRHLATLARFWHTQGEHPRSTSELVRLTLEAFSELLSSKGLVEFITSHQDALEALERLGLNTGVNRSALAEVLSAEDLASGISPDPFHSAKIRRAREGVVTSKDPTLKEAQARLEQMLREQSDKGLINRAEEAKHRTDEFKKLLQSQPESKEESK
jgi:hypothetical protein